MDSSADDYDKKIGNIIFFIGVGVFTLLIHLLGLGMWLNGEFEEDNNINCRDKEEIIEGAK